MSSVGCQQYAVPPNKTGLLAAAPRKLTLSRRALGCRSSRGENLSDITTAASSPNAWSLSHRPSEDRVHNLSGSPETNWQLDFQHGPPRSAATVAAPRALELGYSESLSVYERSILEQISDLSKDIRVLRAVTLLAYMTTVLHVVILAVITPSVISDPTLGMSTLMGAKLAGYSCMAAVAGKMLYALIMNSVCPRAAVLLISNVVIFGMMGFSMASCPEALVASVVFMRVFHAGSWPAYTKAMSKLVEPKRIPEAISWLACCSRSTAFVGAGMIGAFLLMGLGWRQVVWAACGLSSAAILLFALVVPDQALGCDYKSSRSQRDKAAPIRPSPVSASGRSAIDEPHGETLKDALIRFAMSKHVWISILARCCMQIIMEFQVFHTLFLTQVLSVSNGAAAQIAQWFPLGCAVFVLLGGRFLSRLSHLGQGATITAACASLCGVFAWLQGAAALSGVQASLAMGIIGGLLAIPYYLPVTSFNMRFGGKYASTLEGISESFGMLAAVSFDLLVAHQLAAPGGWSSVLQTLGVSAAVGGVLMAIFHLMSYYRRSRAVTNAPIPAPA